MPHACHCVPAVPTGVPPGRHGHRAALHQWRRRQRPAGCARGRLRDGTALRAHGHRHQRGQAGGGTGISISASPGHSSFRAFWQLRRRTRVPVLPQLREQEPHAPHSVHIGSAGKRRGVGQQHCPPAARGWETQARRGPHPTRPRAAAVPRAAPGSALQPPARPPGPCQAIFISAASAIAIKPTMCGRGHCARGGGGGGGCRGAQNLHQQSQNGRPQPSADIPAAGEGPPLGSAAVSSVSLGTGGGRWSRGSGVGSVRGERGLRTWAGPGAARPPLHRLAPALEFLQRGHHLRVDAAAPAALGPAAPAGAPRAGAPGGPVRPVDVLWGGGGQRG